MDFESVGRSIPTSLSLRTLVFTTAAVIEILLFKSFHLLFASIYAISENFTLISVIALLSSSMPVYILNSLEPSIEFFEVFCGITCLVVFST
jgi:hypothetical protein